MATKAPGKKKMKSSSNQQEAGGGSGGTPLGSPQGKSSGEVPLMRASHATTISSDDSVDVPGDIKDPAQAQDQAPDSTPFHFGVGLLPKEAKAEFRRGRWQMICCAFPSFSCEVGLLYISLGSEHLGASFSMGLDIDPRSLYRELCNPLFYRAVIAEFAGTLLFLYFTLSTAVYRGGWIVAEAEPEGRYYARGPAAAADPVPSFSGVAEAGAKGSAHLAVSLVFGLSIFLLVWLLSPISGGHFNPAVTCGLAVTRKITVLRAIMYVAAQCAGGFVGALAARALDPAAFDEAGGGINAVAPEFTSHAAFLSEAFGTFLLVSVVYAAVDPERSSAVIHVSALGPLAIGLAVSVAHLAGLPVTGCGINPARSFAAAAAVGGVDEGRWDTQWLFWAAGLLTQLTQLAAPLSGAVAAALAYEMLFKGRHDFEEKWSA